MRERLLSHCYKFATNGDMKAARLFLEVTSEKRPKTSIRNQQNNFIQVSGTTITEAQLKELTEDQQQQLQRILKGFNIPKEFVAV
ncbi:hypothetical protein SAE01_46330 [Segetibacter aerophilus]|uniref:Uncharacterized protein n=2 Tax=Segetibacter aerophilus TaxID=670293 RepID=A0A512BJZ6_9BACT|nr:hypothetical protein SAE01_46330 [Segetibacter aerophilus]